MLDTTRARPLDRTSAFAHTVATARGDQPVATIDEVIASLRAISADLDDAVSGRSRRAAATRDPLPAPLTPAQRRRLTALHTPQPTRTAAERLADWLCAIAVGGMLGWLAGSGF